MFIYVAVLQSSREVIRGKAWSFNKLSQGRESPLNGMRVAQLPTESLRGELDFVTQEVILLDEILKLPDTDGVEAGFDGNGQAGKAIGGDKNLAAGAAEELSPQSN